MKFEVIGWTNYENDEYPMHSGDYGAVDHAVEEAIRAGGYRFGGDTHQGEESCTPVLNDGTRALFSFREWGYIMAEALSLYNEHGLDYMAWYMDIERTLIEGETLVLPPAGVDKSRIKKRAELAETFSVPVSPAEFEAICSGRKQTEIRTKENGFERVCVGDFFLYECEGNACRVRVEKIQDFPSFAELFGETSDASELRRRRTLINRALYGGCDRSALYNLLTERYPEGNKTLYAAVAFGLKRPKP